MTVSTDPRKTGVRNAPVLLAASGAATAHTGTLTETAIATISIPAGAMGLNGALEIRFVETHTNNANAKTWRVRLGGTSGTIFLQNAPTSSVSGNLETRIRNRNSAASQVGIGGSASFGPSASSGNAVVTSTVNTDLSVDLVITAQLANVADTMTLEAYEVWLLPG